MENCKSSNMTTLGLQVSMPFGQYKGYSIKFIIDTNKNIFLG